MATRRTHRRFNGRGWLVVPVLLLVCYLNIASMFDSAGVRIELYRPWLVRHFFHMFDVFSHYNSTVYGFEAQGRLVTPRPGADESWTEILLYREFFPHTRGEANRRLNMHSHYYNKEYKAKAYHALAATIKRRHNRDHPDEPIDRVRIYSCVWPKSTEGYMARYAERKKTLIVEE